LKRKVGYTVTVKTTSSLLG